MELRHLRYFVTVVEEQSLTKAAEKLLLLSHHSRAKSKTRGRVRH